MSRKGNCIDCEATTHSIKTLRCRSCYNINRWKRPEFETPEELQEDIKKRQYKNQMKYAYKTKYNITEEYYQELLKEQNYCCAICGTHQESLSVRLNVDHDHSCCLGNFSCGNCIRGLLCRSCNMALGGFKDNENILKSALQYIKSYSKEKA